MKALLDQYWPANPRTWLAASRTLMGLFFLSAALFKLNNYFIDADQTLSGHLQYWIDNGWPPQWYLGPMRFAQEHEKLIAALIVALQGLAGVAWITNRYVRQITIPVLVLQIGIFLGTYHHWSFTEFVGISLWFCAYFILCPPDPQKMGKWTWRILTWALAGFLAVHIRNRIYYEDPWLTALPLQMGNLKADIMSISLAWKTTILWLSTFPGAAYIYAGFYWIRIPLVLGLLTKWRLYAGSAFLVLWILTCWTWMNSATSHGGLWVLTMFLWCTQEYVLQKRQ